MAIDIPSIVAVDSMTLVWGLRDVGTDQQCRDAKFLFSQFSARKTQVVISAVSVSEYLTAIDHQQHEAVIAVLAKRFLIQPFTPDCAALAAVLFCRGQKMRTKGVEGGRAILRADTLIIATAKIHGAGCIYSNDGDCRDLANTIHTNFGRDIPKPKLDLFKNPIVE